MIERVLPGFWMSSESCKKLRLTLKPIKSPWMDSRMTDGVRRLGGGRIE